MEPTIGNEIVSKNIQTGPNSVTTKVNYHESGHDYTVNSTTIIVVLLVRVQLAMDSPSIIFV